MRVPFETRAISAWRISLFLALFLAPATADAQWSLRRSADGTVSASAVSPDRSMGSMGVLITCTGRTTIAGVGSRWLTARRGERRLVEWWIYPGGNPVVETWEAETAGGVPSLLAPNPVRFARTLARSRGEFVIAGEEIAASADLQGSYRAIAQVAAACGWTP